MTNSMHVHSKDFLNRLSDTQKQQWARAIINRMMSAWQVSEHKALAKILGIHANTPSNWIQNKSVPWTAIYTCHKETGKSLDWLYDGKMPAVEVTDVMNEKIESTIQSLLFHSELMGLTQQLKDNGYDSLKVGLLASFVDVIKTADQ